MNDFQYENDKKRADDLRKNGQFDDAAEAYRMLADSAPTADKKAAALIGQSICSQLLGRLAEARQYLHDSSQLIDHDSESLINMSYLDAMLDAEEGKDAEVVRKLDKTLAEFRELLGTPELEYQYEKIQIQRAYSLLNLDRPREAMPIFVESASFRVEKPEDFPYRAAYCAARCGRAPEGKILIQKLLAQTTNSRDEARARYYLGLVLACEGKHSEALKEFEFCEARLDDIDSSFIPGLFNLLAGACEKLGLRDRALRYRRASGRR